MRGNRILAIDPGTREIGVAVLEGEELLYYGVKGVRMRKTSTEVQKEAARIIHHLITDYQPQVLAINQPLILQQSAERLALVIREIKRTARGENLVVYEYAPKIVRQFICGAAKATKRETARQVAVRYPELIRYANGKSKWEEMYYARMFGAVAVGIACYQSVRGR